MSAEAWIAIGTWALVLITFLMASWTRRDARAQIETMRQTAKTQVEAAQKAAQDQVTVTERMTQAHIDMLREDLQARLLLHYETRWESPEMVEQRKRLSSLLLQCVGTSEPYPFDKILDVVPNFFETLALLCERGQLDTKMVWNIFGYYARRYGQMLGPFFLRDQQIHGDLSLWTGFMKLIDTLRAMDQQYTKDMPHSFSGEEIKRFFQDEIQV